MLEIVGFWEWMWDLMLVLMGFEEWMYKWGRYTLTGRYKLTTDLSPSAYSLQIYFTNQIPHPTSSSFPHAGHVYFV
jgi:hypothetical protein